MVERRRPRVLVVSENAAVRQGCLRALAGRARVKGASFFDGLVHLGRAQVVIADLSGLPNGGIDFLRHVTAEFPKLPLVVLQPHGATAALPSDSRRACLTLPVRDHLLQGLVGAMCPGALKETLRRAPGRRTPPG